MAAGDLKDVKNAIVIEVTAGATITKGQLVHCEDDDGKWDPTADADWGKFGVAIEGSTDTNPVRVCIWGEVEVTASAAAIPKGALVLADAGVVKDIGTVSATNVIGTIVGTAMTAFGSGGTGTIWVGLVG